MERQALSKFNAYNDHGCPRHACGITNAACADRLRSHAVHKVAESDNRNLMCLTLLCAIKET